MAEFIPPPLCSLLKAAKFSHRNNKKCATCTTYLYSFWRIFSKEVVGSFYLRNHFHKFVIINNFNPQRFCLLQFRTWFFADNQKICFLADAFRRITTVTAD